MVPSEFPPLVEPQPRAASVPSGQTRESSRWLYRLAACLVVATTSWFLLKELGPLLRPLVLAVFLAYLIVPIQQWLARRVPPMAAAAVIVGGTLVLFWGLAVTAYGNVVELNAEMPRLLDRARRTFEEVRAYGRDHLPRGMMEAGPGTEQAQTQVWHLVRASMRILVSSGAGLLAEAFVVGVYLIFLLMELRQFPRRLRAGFTPARAEAILNIFARINTATTRYLRAKVVASLATGIPTAIILWAFGVPYPVMWGVLTFFGNFIPYVGSLIALAFPLLLAFLELEPVWRPCAVALLLVVVQVVTNNFVEPTLTGKAVDLSPLVTLIALAFWGLCWGVTGMLLAIPLTAVLKIVWENLAFTRPLAILMAQGDG
jgi:AI-2 transport protein TqsA